ncbi:Histone acetyltransferase type B catalytic subunit [Termitomyces sp. J132]|nr:Histone acetyltransferase type B catalytic subunit [Termitomyces sp. J132]
MGDWTSDANEALKLTLVRSTEDTESFAEDELYGFHPTFTYPIYGEDEKLYGYQGLEIDLRFASGSLIQYLNIKYTNKLDSTSTVDDVEGILSRFIPPGYFKDEQKFLAFVEEDATTFHPLGQLIHSYTRPALSASTEKGKATSSSQSLDPGREDSVATWNTSGFKELHRRMQIFILLYIEAGSYINEDENSWEFVVLYEKRKRREAPYAATYHFVGYSSLYPFYFFPEKTRMRLSQFVILPPYQHRGHGSELYKAIYQYTLSRPNIAELTLEDPAEAFEDLRDRNDLRMLFNKAWLEKWRNDLKIAGRQFHRLVEMLLLLRLDSSDAAAERAYRIQVKERLYRFNFEILAQLEKEERLEKLEETYQSVRQDYSRILAMVS